MFSFFRARAKKGIAWHIDAGSVVWTLIDNGKLAIQIVKLLMSAKFRTLRIVQM